MGERPDDEVTAGSSSLGNRAVDISVSATDSTEGNTEQIKAEIEQTRSEMSETIEAIQDRLSPSRMLDRAKDSVREATVETVDKVKNVASRAGSSVGDVAGQTREAANVAVGRIRENPIPVALLGVGLAWMAMRARSSARRSSGTYDTETDYAWTEPQWQAETAYGSGSRTQSVWDLVSQNPLPIAVTAVSIGWLVTNLRSGKGGEGWSYGEYEDSGSGMSTGGGAYTSSAYGGSGLEGGGQYDTAGTYGSSGAFASPSYGESTTDTGVGSYSGTQDYAGSSTYTGSRGAQPRSSKWRRRPQEVASQATGAVKDAARRSSERVGELASQAGEVASQAGDAVRGAARRGTERVGEIAGQTSSAVRDAARRSSQRVADLARRGREGVGDMAYRTQNQFDRMLNENPLALGLAALALGAVVGMALPSTETENEYLGETRDSLVDKAKNLAQQTAEQITSNVEQMASTVKDQTGAGTTGNPPA